MLGPQGQASNMRLRSRDTTKAAHRAQLDVYRRMTPEQRLLLAWRMSDDLRAVVADGVRIRHPDCQDEDVERGVLRLYLGEQLFRCAYIDRDTARA